MNQIIVSGRLVDNVAEKRENFVTFTIAWNKGSGDKQKVIFFQVSAFGNAAEFAKKYFKKGTPVEVSGELDSSLGEKDGKFYLNNRILANTVGFYGFATRKEETE